MVRLLVILLFLVYFKTNGQRVVVLNVVGESSKSYSSFSVKLFNCSDTNKLIEYQACNFGIAAFKINEVEECLMFEASGIGFLKKRVTIFGIELKKADTINIFLEKTKDVYLQPVIVRSKQIPIKVIDDTTIYKIANYTDGTERKLEDILVKLPGIDVNRKTGEIKFKGKPIAALMLDGDDLFGKNYTVGSKNINASIIEGVQAIENFSENYVLKDFEKEENVALNIVLKKIPLKVNVGLDLGTGIFLNKPNNFLKDYKVNLLGITNRYKFFNVFTNNNIGENYSTKNFFGSISNLGQRDNASLMAKKFIPESNFGNFLEENRANVNNQTFGNVNGLFHLNTKNTIRINGFVTKDNLKNTQSLVNSYFITNDTITNIDNLGIFKRPLSIDADVYFRSSFSKKILLETTFLLSKEQVKENKNLETNFIPNFLINQNSNSLFVKYQSKISVRVGHKNALQSSFLFSNSSNNQGLEFFPSIISRFFSLSDNQSNIFDKRLLQFKNVLFGKVKNGTYNISLMANNDLNIFHSKLNSKNGFRETLNSLNDVEYIKNELKQGASINYKINRFTLIPSYTVTYLSQKLYDKSKLEKADNIILEPKINVRLKVSPKSSFNFTFANNQKTNVEEHIFANNVLLSNRLIVANIPSLQLLKENYLSAVYNYRDMYNQFEFSSDISYTKSNGDFFSNYNITDSLLYENLFYLPLKNSAAYLTAQFKKYFPVLKSSINFSSNLNKSQYNNSLGNGVIRSNRSKGVVLNLFYKSAFKKKINFINEVTFSKTIFFNQSNSNNKFVLNSLQNKFETNIKFIKSVSFKLNIDTYIANTAVAKNNFSFIDVGLLCKTKSQKFEYRFVAKNLLDLNSFVTFENRDFFKSSNAISILRRYMLFNASLSF